MLALGIISINLALICYTIGVWRQKFLKRVELSNLVFFWAGLVFDTIGTKVMFSVSSNRNVFIHEVVGILAILLMFLHSISATYVYLKKERNLGKTFERLSIGVWAIWLASYILGVLLSRR